MAPFVAVIGAGELGGATAQAIAELDSVRQVRLIDSHPGIAAGKALDIVQAACLDPHATDVVGSADVRHASGAAVVVLADAHGSPSREWQGEEGLALVRGVWSLAEAERTVIVCAGAAQAALVHTAVRELHVDRRRIVGSAPAAFEAAVRALVAIALNDDAPGVALMVLGRPPSEAVACWSQGTVNGASLASRLAAAQIAAIERRVPRLWPPGPYALASAAARAVRSVIASSRTELTTYVFLDGEMQSRDVVTALPVRLGPEGVVRIIEPELSPQERTRLVYA